MQPCHLFVELLRQDMDTNRIIFALREHLDLRQYLVGLPRSTKQIIILVADAIGFFCAVLGVAWVYLIRPLPRLDFFLIALGTMVFAHLVARYLGFYHSIVRYLGMGLLLAGTQVAASSAIVLSITASLAGLTTTPYRLAVVYALFCGFYLVGSRYTAQYFLLRRSGSKEKVIIWGAGESGAGVLQAMQGSQVYSPVAFIDDDSTLHDKQINGLPVHPRKDIEELIDKNKVTRVLLAMPSASRNQR